jgi:hypothetical protein
MSADIFHNPGNKICTKLFQCELLIFIPNLLTARSVFQSDCLTVFFVTQETAYVELPHIFSLPS